MKFWDFTGVWGALSDFFEGLGTREHPILEEPRVKILRPDRPEKWPEFKGSLDEIPVGLRARDEIYGKPVLSIGANNHFKVDRKFARNLGTVAAENFPNYHRRIYMHKIVSVYFIEAMRRAHEVCPDWQPKRIGCFNPRRMRHSRSPNVPFSDHTYGIAFDIDSKTNRAWSRRKYPNRPRPFETGWYKYSDIPEVVVKCFTSVGFDWGGYWNFCDPMHFSLRKPEK